MKQITTLVRFSRKRQVELHTDLNPMLDEGAPTSTRGVNNAVQICNAFAIPMVLKPPRENYQHGWGQGCADAKPIQYTWDLSVDDINCKYTVMTFDLVEGFSPMLVGLDVKRHSDTVNGQTPSFIVFQRPTDTGERMFHTYIAKDEDRTDRIRFDILSYSRSTARSLLRTKVPRQELNMVKKVRRFTHASPKEMKRLFEDAKLITGGIIQACDKVTQACDIFASTGRPTDMKKVSLLHANEAFNQEV